MYRVPARYRECSMTNSHDYCTFLSSGKQDRYRKNFYVRSSETPRCPHCGRVLDVVGSRKRKLRKDDGSTTVLIIRRLRCERCGRVHHELPDMAVPYKRFCADTVEEILSHKGKGTYPCESSTAARLRIWFSLLRGYWEGALSALKNLHKQDEQLQLMLLSLTPVQPSRLAAGWLKKIVRLLVNSCFWLQTRSA